MTLTSWGDRGSADIMLCTYACWFLCDGTSSASHTAAVYHATRRTPAAFKYYTRYRFSHAPGEESCGHWDEDTATCVTTAAATVVRSVVAIAAAFGAARTAPETPVD